jgi:hypothetical protein
MQCSFPHCGIPFTDEHKIGYAVHIFNHEDDEVMWGAYCNADCALSDLGPFFLSKVEQMQQQQTQQVSMPEFETADAAMEWFIQRTLEGLVNILGLELKSEDKSTVAAGDTEGFPYIEYECFLVSPHTGSDLVVYNTHHEIHFIKPSGDEPFVTILPFSEKGGWDEVLAAVLTIIKEELGLPDAAEQESPSPV